MTPTTQARLTSIALLLIAGISCTRKASEPDRAQQKERAVAAKSKLFETLGTRLREVISEGGPAAAISVCADEADAMTTKVGAEHGLRIGRTSAKLRNPGNTVPAWATPIIAEHPSGPVFVDLPAGALGALLPIRLKKMCENCHGEPSSLAQPVRNALTQLYPNDRATGYKEGDLRGWFWLEVPATETRNTETKL